MSDSRRLEMLEKVTGSGQGDSFAWYGLALEYRRLGRNDDALSAFRTLRERDPNYLAQYLMAGQLLVELERLDEARDWLSAGVELAGIQGNAKALGELERELDAID